jgi:hypothetical protein
MTQPTHGRKLIMVSINLRLYFTTLLTLNVLDEVDHADPTPTEDEELYTHKVESTFDERESVLGWFYLLIHPAGADV